MKRLLLLTILALFIGLAMACDAPEGEAVDEYPTPEDEYSKSYERPQLSPEEYERRRQEQIESEKPTIDNSDQFWERNEPRPEATPALKQEELKKLMAEAIEDEKKYQGSVAKCENDPKDKNCFIDDSSLRQAFSNFVTAAKFNPAIIVDVERTANLLMKEKVRALDLIESVLELRSIYQNDPLYINLLAKLSKYTQQEAYSDFKEGNYNPSIRYTSGYYKKFDNSPNREKALPNDCSVDSETIRKMVLAAEAVNNAAEVKKWTVKLADYYSADHYCDGGMGNVWKAYDLYVKAGDSVEAKKMAIAIAQEIFTVFLNGQTAAEAYPDILIRSDALPFDLNFTKEWLGKAGLNQTQIDIWLKAAALRQAKITEEYCLKGWKDGPLDSCQLASKQFKFAGDEKNASRMELLISDPKGKQ